MVAVVIFSNSYSFARSFDTVADRKAEIITKELKNLSPYKNAAAERRRKVFYPKKEIRYKLR